jgi:protein TonB
MGSLLRVLIGVPAAIIVVGALFLLMYGLIKVDTVDLGEAKEPVNIRITQQIEDSELTNQKKFERPQLDQPPPPPPAIDRANFEPAVDGVRAAPPSFNAEVDIGTAFNPDRDAQPLVRVPPSGFERCIGNRASTEVVSLEFDVTPQGQVTNVRTVDSTDSCYNRYAERSAEKWKYQPKIVDGENQWRRGVRTSIRFEVGAE